MNKFIILSCVDLEDRDRNKKQQYKGVTVVMALMSDPSFMLFFPISKDNADVINYVLEGDGEYDLNTDVLGLYTTMLESWKASDRFLSGILMDTVYDQELKDDAMSVKIALSDSDGILDSVINVNFVHALLLCVMERLPIIITDELLNKLLPESDVNDPEVNEEELGMLERVGKNRKSDFPADKNILNIVKNIMEAGPPKTKPIKSNTENTKTKKGKPKETKEE